jgi:hypothetical protein
MDPDNCDHPKDRITHVDGAGNVLIDETLYVWGECACGVPTIITAEVQDVELDVEGSIPHLTEYAAGDTDGQ